MSQRTQVLLIDDLDGSAADETLIFGLDGATYEIDLSAANADQLRKALAEYVAAARRVSGPRAGARRRGGKPSSAPKDVDASTVRSWARDNGYAVNERGRVAAEILEAYRAAH